jgi:hypothetical protein
LTPIDQMASSDLFKMTNNLPNDLAASITNEPWDIADSHEGLFLFVCCQRCHTGRWTSWLVLAIFNPLTSDLRKHPPMANRFHCVGVAILHDGSGNGRFPLPRGASMVLLFHVSTFKVGVWGHILRAWCGKWWLWHPYIVALDWN